MNVVNPPPAPAAPFEVYPVTNAQRLAGTQGDGATPLKAGDYVQVTDQGDRIELALNASDFSNNDNWLVLANSFQFYFVQQGGAMTINGVAGVAWTAVAVGWLNEHDPITADVSPNGAVFTNTVSFSTDDPTDAADPISWGSAASGWVDAAYQVAFNDVGMPWPFKVPERGVLRIGFYDS